MIELNSGHYFCSSCKSVLVVFALEQSGTATTTENIKYCPLCGEKNEKECAKNGNQIVFPKKGH